MSRASYTFARLPDLNGKDTHDFLALRSEVFVVEQNCVFHDPDDADIVSWHLLMRDESGQLLAYLRIVDPAIRYPEPSIGRVVSAPKARGQSIGRAIMAEGIARCEALWPGFAIVIGAQARLTRFYEGFGFKTSGAPYLEDNIWHVEMTRPASSPSQVNP